MNPPQLASIRAQAAITRTPLYSNYLTLMYQKYVSIKAIEDLPHQCKEELFVPWKIKMFILTEPWLLKKTTTTNNELTLCFFALKRTYQENRNAEILINDAYVF